MGLPCARAEKTQGTGAAQWWNIFGTCGPVLYYCSWPLIQEGNKKEPPVHQRNANDFPPLCLETVHITQKNLVMTDNLTKFCMKLF